MKKYSRKFKEVIKIIDQNKLYNINEACMLIKQTRTAQFNESIDLSIVSRANPKYSNQMIRGAVTLPNGTGNLVKILVFASGVKKDEAINAGASVVGDDELIQKIKNGYLDFNKTVATPDMMNKVSKVAKILGPKGLMPNMKLGTITNNISQIVKDLKHGRIEYKTDKSGIIHCLVGKISFSEDKIEENIRVLFKSIIQNKPNSIKGNLLKKVFISLTMGPSIKLNLMKFLS